VANFLRNFIRLIVSLAVVLLIASLYAIINIDLNDYKKEVTEAVEQATGRQLHVEGDLSLAWSLFPKLQVEKATFSNAKWGSQPTMLSLDKFEVNLALLPLLARHIQVTKVALIGSNILIETNAKGVGNWVFGQQPKSAEPEIESTSAIQSVIVNELDIEQAQIDYIDGVTGEKKQFLIDRLSIDIAGLEKPINILLKAIVDDIPLALDGQVGGVKALMDNTNALVALKVNAGGVDVALNGNIAKPQEAKGVALEVELKTDSSTLSLLSGLEIRPFGDVHLKGDVGNDLNTDAIILDLVAVAEGLNVLVKGQILQPQQGNGIALDFDVATNSTTLGVLSGSELPPVGDITLSGALSGDNYVFQFKDFSLNAGETDLSGDIRVSLANDKPDITATLMSKNIDLTVFEQADKTPDPQPKSDRLFSDEPLVFDALKQVDAKVTIKVQEIKTASIKLNKIDVGIDLQKGYLQILPLDVVFAGSELKGHLDLNTGDEVAVLDTEMQVNGFKLAGIEALKEQISGGNTDVYFQAKATGMTVRQMMAGLDGKAIIKVGESQIADGTLGWLGADFLAELFVMLDPFSKQRKGTRLACGVVNFNIQDGIATAKKGIAVQTDNLNIVGDGTINLKNEKIKISIKPEARTGVGINISQLAGLVKVGGTLTKPAAEVDEVAVLAAGASGAAAIATLGLSVVAQGLANRGTADADPCKTALGIK
jgi:uncharacterized protein involved in outer membrane biogenesis